MYLDSRFFDAILDKKIGNFATLVSLELDDLTHLLVVNEGAIAGEFLFAFVSKSLEWEETRIGEGLYLLKSFEQFLRIVFCVEETPVINYET
jgi:hypothetical protein